MIEYLIALDVNLFLFLNGLHSPRMDSIMFFISGKKEWIPLYLVFAGLIIKQFKWQSIWVFLGIGLIIALSDQLASGFMKPFFERLRPSRDPKLDGLVHIVNGYKGGMFGFASYRNLVFFWFLVPGWFLKTQIRSPDKNVYTSRFPSGKPNPCNDHIY